MKLTLATGLSLLLFAGPAIAEKVYIDFDRNYDFDKPTTFAWSTTAETSVEGDNPLLHSRIRNSIEHYLSQGGLTEVSENPDVYVTYHTSSEHEMSLETTRFGYDYPDSWTWDRYGYGHGYGGWGNKYGGVAASTSRVTTYEVGTLVVDVWDASEKRLIWRGTAANIMVTDNPNKMTNRIDKALQTIVKKSRKLEDKKGTLGAQE